MDTLRTILILRQRDQAVVQRQARSAALVGLHSLPDSCVTLSSLGARLSLCSADAAHPGCSPTNPRSSRPIRTHHISQPPCGMLLSLLCTCCMMMVPNRHRGLPSAFPAMLLWSTMESGFEPCFRKLRTIYRFSQGSSGCFLQLHLQKLRGTAPFLNSFWSRWFQHYCSLQNSRSPPDSEETHRDPGFPPCMQERVKSQAWHSVFALYAKGTWKTAEASSRCCYSFLL